MRLLVGLHHLELGGSQLNAVDLAVAARHRGHDVVVFAVYNGQPGPLAEMVRAAGLPLVLVRHSRAIQGLLPVRQAVARTLWRVAVRERIQLVHAYEFPLSLDSFYGPHLRLGIPLVCTIYGQFVPRWLPRYPPVIVGARKVADMVAPLRPKPPALIEPPVNTDTNAPGLIDGAEFRRAHGLGTHIVVGVVSRLEPTTKYDGIELAIGAMQLLDDPRIQLVVTGDGPSFSALNTSAARVNSALGRRAVIMIGSLIDPRPAYAAADIALGVGGSALRAMAFAKPLIVLGTKNFAKLLTPSTAQEFLVGGFGGFWDPGSSDFDPRPLAGLIRELADRPGLRSELGAFGRQLILDRFSLNAASVTLEDIYASAVAQAYPRSQRLWEAARVAVYRTGSEALPDTAKDWLRPMVRPLLHSPGRT